jgi:hypothetical protein
MNATACHALATVAALLLVAVVMMLTILCFTITFKFPQTAVHERESAE